MKNNKQAALDTEIDKAQEFLSELEELAQTSTAIATSFRMDWSEPDGKAIEISKNVKKPVNTKYVSKAVAVLSNYHERADALDRLIKALSNSDDAADSVADAKAISKKLEAAYKAAVTTLHTTASKGFPEDLASRIKSAVEFVSKSYDFDPDDADDPFRAYVWFNADSEPFYGATITLHDVKSKGSTDVVHDVYTLCFAAKVTDGGSLVCYVRGDAGKTLPIKGNYPETNIFTDVKSLERVITSEMDTDDIALQLNKIDLPLQEEDLKKMKINEKVLDVQLAGKKTLEITVAVPFKDKASITRATTDFREILAGIFGMSLKANLLRISAVESEDKKGTTLRIELVSRVDTSGKPQKHLMSLVKIIAPQLGLKPNQVASLQRWVRNGEA